MITLGAFGWLLKEHLNPSDKPARAITRRERYGMLIVRQEDGRRDQLEERVRDSRSPGGHADLTSSQSHRLAHADLLPEMNG